MKKRSKPISPHLQIYKPQITSILSISHRITGVVLFFSSYLICFWLFSLAFHEDLKIILNNFFLTNLGKILFFFITLSFIYHFLNGIRHLFWDLGYGFKIMNVYLTGIIIILLSLTLNIYIWFF